MRSRRMARTNPPSSSSRSSSSSGSMRVAAAAEKTAATDDPLAQTQRRWQLPQWEPQQRPDFTITRLARSSVECAVSETSQCPFIRRYLTFLHVGSIADVRGLAELCDGSESVLQGAGRPQRLRGYSPARIAVTTTTGSYHFHRK